MARKRNSSFIRKLKYRLLMAHVRRYKYKQISAMVRVKNEEEFLYTSIKSIIDCVDEIVLDG